VPEKVEIGGQVYEITLGAVNVPGFGVLKAAELAANAGALNYLLNLEGDTTLKLVV
jgi:thiamine biosynthesis lipoprotein ApbE